MSTSDAGIESAVCHLDAEGGRLTYRGYDVTELAEHTTFEEVAHLLVAGALPTPAALKELRKAWHATQRLDGATRRWLRSVPTDADELTVLRTAVSGFPLWGQATGEGVTGISTTVLALLARPPVIAAERLRMRRGAATSPGWGRKGVASGYLRVATGLDPDPTLARALDAALILRADNELNPGTFAARVAASTGADITSCVVAALGALAGPKHSGHTLAVARLLAEVTDVTHASGVLDRLVASGKSPPGFGHPVYRGEDPRTATARRVAEQAASVTGRKEIFERARAFERVCNDVAGLYANVDYYLTVVYQAAGLPQAAFAPLFAVARMPGWIAHVMEQGRDPDLIRPRARYTGPMDQQLGTPRRRPARRAPTDR